MSAAVNAGGAPALVAIPALGVGVNTPGSTGRVKGAVPGMLLYAVGVMTRAR